MRSDQVAQVSAGRDPFFIGVVCLMVLLMAIAAVGGAAT
jgi:hypothetical protein